MGTKTNFDFGSYVFDETMNHGDSFAVKLPIAFSSFITEVILSQHPNILFSADVPSKKSSPITFDYMLFVGTYVPYNVLQTNKDVGSSSSKEVVLS